VSADAGACLEDTGTMPYRTLEHTADLAIEVMGASLEELFAESLFALTDCMTRVERVRPRESREVALVAPALDQLLVVFLNEGIWLHETEALVFSEADLSVAEGDQEWSLTGNLRGEVFDLHRHGLKTLIKAVTYHQLSVGPGPDGWIARVIFDI
jgi:SHS2 domain-containing protein